MTASPTVVWELISDVTRIGEFSPETFEAEWLDGASGPALGAHFRGHVKRNGIGPIYWTACKVTSCEPERDFGFAVYAGGRAVNNWRYRLAPRPDGGTDVTESFELSPSPVLRAYWAVAGWRRRLTNERGMRQTLERIRAIAEAQRGSATEG
ncbi:MAG: SRPBCC family protein [Actinomycetota bacterium]|nr:SRPBCC family protein [Actinomycetota bacterium]